MLCLFFAGLDPPEFGSVFLTIKPKNGDYVSDFDKNQILSDLKQYSLTGINQKILDLKVLLLILLFLKTQRHSLHYQKNRTK